jgi:type I restriction enzyme, R subunit
MTSQTNEQALEALIEKALTGSSREQRQARQALGEPEPLYSRACGYEAGHPGDFDREFALDKEKFWRFLESTQPQELDKLKSRTNWQRLLLERLQRKVKKEGLLKLLKDGLSIDDAHFTLFYSPPYTDLNPLIAQRFAQNIFSVTRQVHYSRQEPAQSLDVVLFVNGLPIVTMELKNQWTGQTAYHAMRQYEKRDHNQTLLQFGRCLVHFALDTDDVYMTTRLAGKNSFFLPFNKGHNYGKGNPPNPNGHKTAYLWEEILQRESLANILQHFAVLAGKKRDTLPKKKLYFPRYHQLDVVRCLLDHARRNGPGHTYLIQHSAGSGKSHSITWTAYQLIELYAPGQHAPLFDSVVVVTDRRVLDRQLHENIDQFSEVKNILAHADSSADLKSHLETGKKIIITTIQKFPYIVDGMEDMSHKTFAVILDEAHSSQSGVAADKLSATLGADDEEEPEDAQDRILQAMADRKLGRNASYFAFTATPKNATLEKFGWPDAGGRNFRPFHLYSMKQAIEEGFILDVLASYTTYQSYYQIEKSIRENPLFATAKAQKKLRAYVEGHRETIAVKAEIIVEHFLQQVAAPKKLKGQAKGMVATRNITTAIRYYQAIRAALQQANAPFEAIVAFSGKKLVDGIEYTEESCNGFPSKEIEARFDSDDSRLLVVANKFLTGFDQPKLSVMYVDKKLQGLTAVQTLSRLNRSANDLGKRTEDLFILDFFNSVSDIKQAFDPYYTATTLSEPTDVNVLHDLKDALDDVGVYDWPEVTQFSELYFAKAPAEQLSPIIDLCADRFKHGLELEEDEKADFKIKAKQFVKIYAQVAALLPFNHLPWEMLYWFLKFLIPKLTIRNPNQDALDELLNSVDLSTYGLERNKLGYNIALDPTASELEPQNPNPRGVHGGDEQKDPLDEIIRQFNERWFAGWDATPLEQRVKFINIARHVAQHPDYAAQVANNPDEQNRRLALERLISLAVGQERRRELDLYKRYASDPDFKRAFDVSIARILESEMMGQMAV